MTQRRSWSFDSVIVSVMLSESKVFRCHELPDWQRWLWLIWAMLPGIVAELCQGRRYLAVILVFVAIELWQDWQAGWRVILYPLVPVPVVAG